MAQTRQLAAIMFTDIVGYTSLMARDEKKAFEVLQQNLRIHESAIQEFNGRLVKELGDGILASFPTVSDALNAAINIQKQCNEAGGFKLSIGIHQGEVMVDKGDIFGDAVNVASRIRALGTAGSVLFSDKVVDEVKNKAEFKAVSLGRFELKNVALPIEVFALGNEGFPVPKRGEIQGRITRPGIAGAVNLKTAATLGTLLLIAVVAYYFLKPGELKKENSIAVLAFDVMSPGEDLEYLGDGFSEELIHKLHNVPGLLVTARTSAFHFKGKNEDVRSIGKKLGVNYLLEGSVRKDGDAIRVTAQLVSALDGNHIWSGTFNKTMKGILNAQDEIAEAVVDQLKMKMLGVPKSGTLTNPEAYNYYLKGRYFSQQISDTTLIKAVSMFRKAIEIDSGNATYWAALTHTLLLQHLNFLESGSFEKAVQAYRHASALDSNLSEVISAFAWIKLSAIDWKGANVDFKRALAIDPNNVDALFGRAFLASALGRRDESIKLLNRAIQVDPLVNNPYVLIGDNHMREGRFADAENYWSKGIELAPEATNGAYYLMGISKMLQGKHTEAIAVANKETKEGFKEFGLVQVYYAAGQRQKSDSIFKKNYSNFARIGPYFIGEAFAFRGEVDSAFVWLDRAAQVKDFTFVFMNGSPFLKKIEKDPRYKKIVERVFGGATYTP